VVVTYLLAFAIGIFGFAMAFRDGRRIAGILGIILSVVGVISFAVEGSHWLFDHHRSWLAFSPVCMLTLVLIACVPGAASAKPSVGRQDDS
jgi:hypothetical protein